MEEGTGLTNNVASATPSWRGFEMMATFLRKCSAPDLELKRGGSPVFLDLPTQTEDSVKLSWCSA